MAGIVRKVQLLCDTIVGNLLKLRVNYDLYVRKQVSMSSQVEPMLMVTLTSYGHRLRKSVQYTLYSLLKQTLRPAKIVLWVDVGEFASESLPMGLQVLQRYGVEIREYPPQIRSYKKLIPALEQFPEYHHIIVDDDLYYSSNFIQTLWEEHQKQTEAIVSLAVTIPVFAEDGKTIIPYKQWPQYVAPGQELIYNPKTLMQLGYGGILYPNGTFDDEVLKDFLYTKLCPMADDLWFYIQSVRLGIPKRVPIGSSVKYYQIDLIRQVLSKDRLHDTNYTQGQNNTQLDNLLVYYNLRIANE